MTTIVVGNNGFGSYSINGQSNPALSFIRGQIYYLEINASGHPFWIQTVPGGYSSINIYSTGVTNNGIDNGTITFIVPIDAPNTLYYACQYHSSMQGSIIITYPVVCFKEDTKILTNKGYIQVQHLRKGDLVKTLNHDFKPIDMIGKRELQHPALPERMKDQLYKCSQDEYPELFEPLIITGCHSILIDSFISEEQKQKVIEVNGNIYVTDEKYRLPACADPRSSVYETPGTYNIYHLALENEDYYMNYGIYANGLLVETCSKRCLKELSNMTLLE